MAITEEGLAATRERLDAVRKDIAAVRREKEEAIEAQDFERAAKARDREKRLLTRERELSARLPPEPPLKTLDVAITREATCLRIGSRTSLPGPDAAGFNATRIGSSASSSWYEYVIVLASTEEVQCAKEQAALWLLKVARQAEARLKCRVVLTLTFQ